MGVEIERKYLVADDSWRELANEGQSILQGYICTGPPASVRVRITGDQAMINFKKATLEIVRDEFEYPIPLDDARWMLGRVVGGYYE